MLVSDKDGIRGVMVGNVPSDDEFLSTIGPPLQPVAAALAGAIRTARAFCRIATSFRSHDARLLTCLNAMKDTGETASPRRKWICAAGRILFLLPESSFWNGLRRIDCVMQGSRGSAATRMLATLHETALLRSVPRSRSLPKVVKHQT
jgi:hypothetical protein